MSAAHSIDPGSEIPIGLRRAPKQARSRARVDAAINALVEMIGEQPGRSITAADVAERIGIPVGSLYEYFEDAPSIVDAAVARMLDRHDELLREASLSAELSLHELIDRMFDMYLRLYSEQPAFIVLRNSPFWNEQHRRWLTDRVEMFLADITAAMWRQRSLADGPSSERRFSLVFAASDAMLQRIFREGPEADPILVADARTAVKFMFDHVATSSD